MDLLYGLASQWDGLTIGAYRIFVIWLQLYLRVFFTLIFWHDSRNEQVAASMKKDVDAQIPNYTNLPSKLLCLLHNVTLHVKIYLSSCIVLGMLCINIIASHSWSCLLSVGRPRNWWSVCSDDAPTRSFCKNIVNCYHISLFQQTIDTHEYS